jgi:hypothetical protein
MKGSSFTALNLWQNAEGKTICQDQRTLSFYAPNEKDRAIDISVTLKAIVGDVTFGDTKEGSMGIRMAPQFRLRGEVAKGSAINSEGVVGKPIWGKRASWVSYVQSAPPDLVARSGLRIGGGQPVRPAPFRGQTERCGKHGA